MNTPEIQTLDLKAIGWKGAEHRVTMRVIEHPTRYGNGTAVDFQIEGAEDLFQDTRYMDWGQWDDLMEFAEWQLRDMRGLKLIR